MKDRIKKIRCSINLTQQEFAEKLKISRSNIATYETGKSEPSDAVITLICKTYGSSEQWLRYGIGEMFVNKSREQEIADEIDHLMIGENADFKRRLIRILSSLKEEHWGFLVESAKIFLAEKKEKNEIKYDEKTLNDINLLLELDPEDRAEIRGTIKQMLKDEKYAEKKELLNA